MRSFGEQAYRQWHSARIQETSPALIVFCLLGQTSLFAAVGAAAVYFCDWNREPVIASIGMGLIAYAIALAFYTLLGLGRRRRETIKKSRQTDLARHAKPASTYVSVTSDPPFAGTDSFSSTNPE